MTVKIADDLLGSRGGDWGILAAAAFHFHRCAIDRLLYHAALPSARSFGRLGQIGSDGGNVEHGPSRHAT